MQRVINSNLIIAESFISCRSLDFFCFDGFLVSCHKHGFVCIVRFLVLCRWRSSQIKTHHLQCNVRTGIVTFSAGSAGGFQQVCTFLVSGSTAKFILALNHFGSVSVCKFKVSLNWCMTVIPLQTSREVASGWVLVFWRASEIKTHHFRCNARTSIFTFSAGSGGGFKSIWNFLASGSTVKFILALNILVQCQFSSSEFLSTGEWRLFRCKH